MSTDDKWMTHEGLLASYDHHISVLEWRIANDTLHLEQMRADRAEEAAKVESAGETS